MKVVFKHKGGREQVMQQRYAKILQGLGRGAYLTRDMRATEIEDELTELRAEYQEVVGKRAYHGWDAETLRAKISDAQAVK